MDSKMRKRKVSSQSLIDTVISAYNETGIHEDEYLAALKLLYNETIAEDVKIEKLVLIQEGIVNLSNNINVQEFVVSSLQALYQHLSRSKKHFYLQSQILVTATQVLLSAKYKDEEECNIYDLSCKHRDFLLQASFTSNIQKSEFFSPLVSNIGAQCLEEMELEMPGIISEGSIDQIWSICRQKNISGSYVQSAVILLSQITKNQDAILRKKIGCCSAIEEHLVQRDNFYGNSAPYDIALSLLDCLPFMCPIAAYHTFSNIVEILNNQNPKTFNGILKMWLSKLSFSSDILWLHLSLYLQHCFLNGTAVPDEDKQYLFNQLCKRANHAKISPAERLLLLDWVETILESKSKNQNYFVSHLKWVPGPFDGNDTFVKKMRIMVSSMPETSIENTVLPLVACLRKSISYNKSVKSSSVLLRTLFFVLNKIRDRKDIENHSAMLAVSLLEQSMHSMRLVIDFIKCVKACDPKSGLPEALWKGILNKLISLDIENAYDNLKWLLLCLHHIGQSDFPIDRIKSFLRFLGKLVDSCPELHSDWINAHLLLSELTHLLGRSDVGMLYSELGDILHCLSQPTFKDNTQPDIDICSKAKICYAAVMRLTPNKVRQLFSSSSSITQPVVNVTSDVRLTAPFLQQKMSPILLIEKCSSETVLENDTKIDDIDTNLDEIKCKATNGSINVKLKVKYANDNVDENDFSIFGITLKTHVNANVALPIEDIEIPSLTKTIEKEIVVNIKPLKTCPVLLKFSVSYTSLSGESFFSTLDSEILLNVEDLFQTVNCDSTEKFNEVWGKMKTNSHSSYSTCFVPIEMKNLTEKWKDFVVSEEQSEKSAAIFMLPGSYLLMKLRESTQVLGTQIYLVTDNLDCLPWINNYFNSL